MKNFFLHTCFFIYLWQKLLLLQVIYDSNHSNCFWPKKTELQLLTTEKSNGNKIMKKISFKVESSFLDFCMYIIKLNDLKMFNLSFLLLFMLNVILFTKKRFSLCFYTCIFSTFSQDIFNVFRHLMAAWTQVLLSWLCFPILSHTTTSSYFFQSLSSSFFWENLCIVKKKEH